MTLRNFARLTAIVGGLALLCLGQGLGNGAQAQPASPLTKATVEAGSLHAKGKASFNTGELLKAIEFYSKAIGISPQYAEAWLDRGIARLAEGKFSLAVTDFDKGIELLPASATPGDRVDALMRRSRARLGLGQVRAALTDLDLAATVRPRSGPVFATRALARAIAKMDDAALADAESSIAFDAYSSTTNLARAVRADILAARKRYAEADSELRWIARSATHPIPALRSVYMLGVFSEPTMTMRIVRQADSACEPSCPEWISLQGRIAPNQQADFSKLLDRLGKKKLPVLIDSQGGNVEAGLAIGRMIRERELDVVVGYTWFGPSCDEDVACKSRLKGDRVLGTASNIAASCASACVYILAAGSHRIVGALSRVGVHQITFYRTYPSPPDASKLDEDRRKGRIVLVTPSGPRLLGVGNDDIYVKTLQYYREMDVDSSVMEHLLAAPRNGMSWLSMTDLVSTGLVTGSGFVAQYLHGKSAPPPVVTLPAPVKIEPAATRDDLVRDLNRELVRLGCMALQKDLATWSATSRTALSRYSALMGRQTSTKEPTQQDLDVLRRHKRSVCPSPCPSGTVEQDKLCVTAEAGKS